VFIDEEKKRGKGNIKLMGSFNLWVLLEEMNSNNEFWEQLFFKFD
jgi:hypothetical protein